MTERDITESEALRTSRMDLHDELDKTFPVFNDLEAAVRPALAAPAPTPDVLAQVLEKAGANARNVEVGSVMPVLLVKYKCERNYPIEWPDGDKDYWTKGGGQFTIPLEEASQPDEETEDFYRGHDAEFLGHDVLEILCRVFDDGADVAMEEWREWYKTEEWFGPARGLGAFIRQRLAAPAPTPERKEELRQLLAASMHIVCSYCGELKPRAQIANESLKEERNICHPCLDNLLELADAAPQPDTPHNCKWLDELELLKQNAITAEGLRAALTDDFLRELMDVFANYFFSVGTAAKVWAEVRNAIVNAIFPTGEPCKMCGGSKVKPYEPGDYPPVACPTCKGRGTEPRESE